MLLERDIEELREACCRVLVAADGLPAPILRGAVPGCVAVRRHREGWCLTLLKGEDAARDAVRDALPAAVLYVEPLSLEELFVELVGERGEP